MSKTYGSVCFRSQRKQKRWIETVSSSKVLDGKLVYLSEYSGQSPWTDHSDEEYNYAAHIYE